MPNQLPLPPERSYALEAPNGASGMARWNGGAEPPGPTDAGLKRYIGALWRHKWMILGIVALGTGLGFVLASREQPIYRTGARVWIGSQLAGGQVGAPLRQGTLLTDEGWSQLLTSSAVLDTVVRRNRLYLRTAIPTDTIAFANFGLKPGFRPGSYTLRLVDNRSGFVLSDQQTGVVVQRGAVGDSVGNVDGVNFAWVPPPAALPANRALEFTVDRPAAMVTSLTNDLTAPLSQDGRFMNIRLSGTERDRLKPVLTEILERFEEVSLQLKREKLTLTAQALETQKAAAELKLTTAESELRNFEIATITEPTAQGVPVNPGIQQTQPSALGNYWQLNTQKDQYQRDREAIMGVLGSRDTSVSVITALEMIPSVRSATELRAALQSAAETDVNIRTLLLTYTELHSEVDKQRRHLDSLRVHVIPSLARQLASQLSVQEQTYDNLIRNAGQELKEIPNRSIRQKQLERTHAVADELFRYLEGEWQRARLAEVTTVPDIQILDWPQDPARPVQDPRLRMLLMCMAGSFGLALLGAILRDRFDPRLRYPDEVTGGMGLFILGAVPALRRGKLGATDMALAVEAFRAIQLSLLHAYGAEAPLVVTLTSPGASDGKSFVASNLAIAFADMGHRTLVVDGDVRRGTIHQLLGTPHKPGLTDFLAGHATREQIVQSTRYTLLDVIGCGSRGEAGPKLLGSAAMTRLMEALRQDYDIILVDSPPLGACVDPMILGTLTRNLALVLRTGTTDRTMAESKLQILDRLPVRVLGAILNDVPARGPYRYYSYISGYEVLDEVAVGQEVTSLPASELGAEPAADGPGAARA